MKKCLDYKAKYKIRVDTDSDAHAEVAAGKNLILKGTRIHAQTKLSQICEWSLTVRIVSFRWNIQALQFKIHFLNPESLQK